jgi:hypothetical protein
MQYITLKLLLEKAKKAETDTVTIPKDMFDRLLENALRTTNFFDERHYLSTYTDIREAVRNKTIASAADHYFRSGYFENRVPKKITVDEKFYIEQNPDVAAGLKSGKVKSCQEHFETQGFFEGREPYENFSMF